MGDLREPELTLAEALAIRERYGRVGYPNKALHHILTLANREIEAQASLAVERITKGLCTECWGDGFKSISAAVLSGPCEKCDGTGHATLRALSDQVTGQGEESGR